MDVRLMKRIDHWGGIPICLGLDLVRKFSYLLPKSPPRPPRRILVMKYFGMGSILLASPMLRALKKQFPNSRIGFLTFAANEQMVRRLGLVDEIYTLRTETAHRFAGDVLRQIRAIRKRRYDVAIDLEFFSKFSTIMAYLSGAPVRIGYFLRKIWRGDLLTNHIYYNHYHHITEVFAALVAPLGVTVDVHQPVAPAVSELEDAAAAGLLSESGARPGELLIGFNVNAGDLSTERRWPAENFRELAATLLTELRARLVFLGASADREYVESVLRGIGSPDRVVNLAGRTDLGTLLGVIRRLGLFVSNDSGPLHLAAALGVPTVSFYGPETPTLYGPRGGDPLVFHANLYCSPCLNVFNVKTAPCSGENVCMRSIGTPEVLEAMRLRFADLWTRYGREG